MDIRVLTNSTRPLLELDVPTWLGSSTDNFWSFRAQTMMLALLRSLNAVPTVNFPAVHDYLALDKMLPLLEHPILSESGEYALRDYVYSLPGYCGDVRSTACLNQHRYVAAMFSNMPIILLPHYQPGTNTAALVGAIDVDFCGGYDIC